MSLTTRIRFFFSIIRRESFCKILNISSSSYKVMQSSMICCFCMKKRASTVKLMCLISIIYLTFIQFLVKINAILICNFEKKTSFCAFAWFMQPSNLILFSIQWNWFLYIQTELGQLILSVYSGSWLENLSMRRALMTKILRKFSCDTSTKKNFQIHILSFSSFNKSF